MNKADFTIKENSVLAKIAAKKMRSTNVAMVLGKTIHLYGVSETEFLQDVKWVKHELCHIKQYKEHGYFIFVAKYLWESLKKGYYNNKFEVEARAAENL